MQITELGLDSPLVNPYFQGDNSYVPVDELLYLHSHPLVRPSFLADIEFAISSAAVVVQQRRLTGKPVDRYVALACQLGTAMGDTGPTKENAAQILEILRGIYSICCSITGSTEFRAP